jgi:hypothetical protein
MLPWFPARVGKFLTVCGVNTTVDSFPVLKVMELEITLNTAIFYFMTFEVMASFLLDMLPYRTFQRSSFRT